MWNKGEHYFFWVDFKALSFPIQNLSPLAAFLYISLAALEKIVCFSVVIHFFQEGQHNIKRSSNGHCCATTGHYSVIVPCVRSRALLTFYVSGSEEGSEWWPKLYSHLNNVGGKVFRLCNFLSFAPPLLFSSTLSWNFSSLLACRCNFIEKVYRMANGSIPWAVVSLRPGVVWSFGCELVYQGTVLCISMVIATVVSGISPSRFVQVKYSYMLNSLLWYYFWMNIDSNFMLMDGLISRRVVS